MVIPQPLRQLLHAGIVPSIVSSNFHQHPFGAPSISRLENNTLILLYVIGSWKGCLLRFWYLELIQKVFLVQLEVAIFALFRLAIAISWIH